MSIVLIIFWFDVLAAFICAATERFFLCGVNVVLAVLLAFIAMVYEGASTEPRQEAGRGSRIAPQGHDYLRTPFPNQR